MPPEPSEQDFRRAAGQFGTGITVVTTVLDGVDHAMTVNSFTAVSLRPLLVLMCAERQTRFHDAVLAAGQWAVSILDESSRPAAVWLATKGRPLAGQLDGIAHSRGPLTGAAVLDGALSVLECRTTAEHDGGDHTIVVGQVLGVRVTGPDLPPLMYHRGDYRRLTPGSLT